MSLHDWCWQTFLSLRLKLFLSVQLVRLWISSIWLLNLKINLISIHIDKENVWRSKSDQSDTWKKLQFQTEGILYEPFQDFFLFIFYSLPRYCRWSFGWRSKKQFISMDYEIITSRAPDKVRISIYVLYIFFKSYVWPLVRNRHNYLVEKILTSGQTGFCEEITQVESILVNFTHLI